jgi:hypothetical protein
MEINIKLGDIEKMKEKMKILFGRKCFSFNYDLKRNYWGNVIGKYEGVLR